MSKSLRLLSLTLVAGCSSSSGTRPTATFTAPDHGSVGEALAFDASGSRAASRYSWDFGDGTRGGGDKLAHAFSSAGTFSVKLTAVGNGGGSASDSLDITITAPSPGPMTPVVGVVHDSSGAPLVGVSVQEGAVTTTSDTDGLVRLTLSGERHLLRLSKSGYASQFQPLDLRNVLSGYFEATMQTRQPSQPLDAQKGGQMKGPDGATLTLPGGALVDSQGAPVTGMVDVALTPVDVTSTNTRDAFPGRYEGLTPDANRGPIMSYGTVEYAIERAGERLQLAPGRTATIDLPVYAGLGADGKAVKAGDTIPLWSLDENSGAWVQEGQGTVTATPGAPNQISLHTEVGHFSWWNGDTPMPNPTNIGIQCSCQSDEAICAMFGKNAYTCHIDGSRDSYSGPTADSMAPPAYRNPFDTVGPATMTIPAYYNLTIRGSAMAGTLAGSVPVRVTPGQSTMLTINLAPMATVQALPDETVTLPYVEPVTNDRQVSKHTYHVHLNGGALSAAFEPEVGTSAGLRLLDASGALLGTALCDSQSGAITMPLGAGDYVVELYVFSQGSGQISLRAGTVTDDNFTLPFDAPVSLTAGDEHRYHFTATAGESIDVKWDSGGLASMGLLTVTAPDGSTVFTNDHLDTSFDWPFTAVSGSYVVSIQAINDVSGVLHVLLPNGAGDGGAPTDMLSTGGGDGGDAGPAGVMPISLPFTLSITTAVPTQSFSFTAAAGTGVLIRAQSAGGDGSIILRTAGGAVIKSMKMDAFTGNCCDSPYHPVYLAGGDYLLEVDPPTSNNNWLLDLWPMTNIVPVTTRANMTGTFLTASPSREVVGFSFNANAGDQVVIDPNNNGQCYTVWYQDQSIFGATYYGDASKPITVASSGPQLVALQRPQGCTGTSYNFSARVAMALTPGTPTAPFTVGDTSGGHIQELFSFSAPASTLVCGKVTSSQGTMNSQFSAVPINSTLGTYQGSVGQSYYSNDFGPSNMTNSGAQVVTVDAPMGGTTGYQMMTDAVLWLYEVPSPSPVADPTLTLSTALRPGEQKWYAFTSDPGNGSNWASGKTKLTLTYQTVGSDCAGSQCNGKAILYQDPNNGSAFYQATSITSSYAGYFGSASGTSASATIPSPGPTTWYVQMVPDPRYWAPVPSPSPFAFTGSWSITASP